MTLTSPPEFLQTKNSDYDARRLRYLFQGVVSEGVGQSGDLAVTQRAAGANMSVDVAAGRAWVVGDDIARQGIYHIANDAPVNVAIPNADPASPRIDRVVLRVYDTTVIGGGLDDARLEVVQGTPTAGTTLATLAGAAAVPASTLLLANVLVPAAAATIPTANIANLDTPALATGAGQREIVLHSRSDALFSWANMPAALTELPSVVPPRAAADLSSCSAARILAQQGAAGSAAAELRVQWSTDQATWSYLDGTAGPGVIVGVGASLIKRGAWVPITAAARADVYLRVVGINGSGAVTPTFGKIALQVR